MMPASGPIPPRTPAMTVVACFETCLSVTPFIFVLLVFAFASLPPPVRVIFAPTSWKYSVAVPTVGSRSAHSRPPSLRRSTILATTTTRRVR